MKTFKLPKLKFDRHNLAPLGLYIALLAALASLGLYIVRRAFDLPLQISLGFVLIGFALYALLDPKRVREAFTGRQARYGSNALVMSLAFVGILVVINFLIVKYPKRWDLTENKQYTLAPESIATLNTLTQPVTAQAFYTARLPTTTVKGLLDQYKFNSSGKFSYEFIDPEKDPVSANQAKITRDGTLLIKMGENQEIVTLVDEQDITGAMVRLINPGKRTVYFLVGHGEFDPGVSGEKGYTDARVALEKKNYLVKTINLLATNKIPEDAKVLIIAGPLQPVSTGEIELIKSFLQNGNGLIVMEEPLPVTEFADKPDPLADYLAESWGTILQNDIVIDPTSSNPLIVVENSYGKHLITQKMGNVDSFFLTARSVKVSPGGLAPTQLVLTAEQAWGETDLAGLIKAYQDQTAPRVTRDTGVDNLGVVSIAAAVEDTTSNSRVVVFGDSDFASDNFFAQYGNGDLFINTMDWVSGQENQISLTAKDNTARMVVAPGKYTIPLILLGTVFVIPGLIVVAGVVTWIQRRRRG